ncbi:MAG TPA: hypothetical protein VGG63_10845 [Steroidobacteraceae bacterium]|jgi:hypothetical protein
MRHPSTLAASLVLSFAAAAAAAQAKSVPPKLQPLSIAAGTWLYHGADMATSDQKGGDWTWWEKCGWSDNDAFMACSFVMNGPEAGKVVKSLAISTYNGGDGSYWHYEAFDSGGDGGHPFISRMTVSGATWTYDGKAGNQTYRVIYHYDSPVKVTLRIEQSTDAVHWTTVARGEGRKQ